MADPFTIRIFLPDGDPEGVRVFDRMNWTGVAVAFPRSMWSDARQRPELHRPGVYILVGYPEEDAEVPTVDVPTVYVGQGDGVRNRIDDHIKNKDFWSWGIAFVSTSGGLNRAHVTWLEYALVKRATDVNQCHLDNGNQPQEPAMTEAERADTEGFLREILQILPLAGLRAFETPKAVAKPLAADPSTQQKTTTSEIDTVVVPAQKEGFRRVFLGEDCWYAIRMSGGMLDAIKYIAAYQSQPVSAITHYAPVARIEPYGDQGKYKVVFSEKARTIGPIRFGDAPQGVMQGPRYTSFARLETATKLMDLWS